MLSFFFVAMPKDIFRAKKSENSNGKQRRDEKNDRLKNLKNKNKKSQLNNENCSILTSIDNKTLQQKQRFI